MHTFFHHSTTHPHESVHSHHQSKRPNFETWSLEMTCSMSTIVCVEFSSGSDITHFCLWIFIHISFGWLGLEVEEVETYRSLRCFYERGVPLAVVQTCENFVTFIKPVSVCYVPKLTREPTAYILSYLITTISPNLHRPFTPKGKRTKWTTNVIILFLLSSVPWRNIMHPKRT